jgi:predicted transcriptional regulator
MESNQLNSPNTFQHKRQGKIKEIKSQLQTIFQYLQTHNSTASMVTAATGVPQKNITRYKRDLEKAGLLWEIEKKKCKCTGFKAWYLTTNPKNAPFNNQLNLFKL